MTSQPKPYPPNHRPSLNYPNIYEDDEATPEQLRAERRTPWLPPVGILAFVFALVWLGRAHPERAGCGSFLLSWFVVIPLVAATDRGWLPARVAVALGLLAALLLTWFVGDGVIW
jgi:hypothetical protein